MFNVNDGTTWMVCDGTINDLSKTKHTLFKSTYVMFGQFSHNKHVLFLLFGPNQTFAYISNIFAYLFFRCLPPAQQNLLICFHKASFKL